MKKELQSIGKDFKEFLFEISKYLIKVFHIQFIRFESGKGIFVNALYKQRGKMAGKLIHSGMAGLTAFGVMIAPVVAQEFPGMTTPKVDPWNITSSSSVLSASAEDPEVATSISEKGRTEIVKYTVVAGDTLSSIAQKFGISTDTIRWQNNMASKDSIKEGEVLEILPIDGVSHKVQKGDNIYSIGKKYGLTDPSEVQAIVDYQFNTFVNDETFELAVGQTIIVPGGEKADDKPKGAQGVAKVKQVTPNAGTVVASGSFAWPTSGIITQRFSWYHKAIDVANPAAPVVLAADAGRVIGAGWDSSGYGNRVIIDHGNGFRTLYAHMSKLFVTEGQTVNRGNAIGQMGSTGHSTGTHLHFEVMQGGTKLNPLSVLR